MFYSTELTVSCKRELQGWRSYLRRLQADMRVGRRGPEFHCDRTASEIARARRVIGELERLKSARM